MDEPKPRARVVVRHDGNLFEILEADQVSSLRIRMDRTMVDFGKEVVVRFAGAELFRGKVQVDQDVRRRTLQERGDPRGIWDAEVQVLLPVAE
jgi:hypothetical protein